MDDPILYNQYLGVESRGLSGFGICIIGDPDDESSFIYGNSRGDLVCFDN